MWLGSPGACVNPALFKVDTGAQDVSCTPTIIGGHAYFGDWAGQLYKVDAVTGQVAWALNVTELVWPGGAGATNAVQTRTSPTDDGAGNIIIGTQTIVPPGNPKGVQGYVVSLKASDGSVNWRAVPDSHPFAIITASPTVYKGAVYVGVSSNEELVDGIGLECCTFRGSVVKLDLKTGAKQWQFHTAPDNGGKVDGWSGNAVWGSAPTIVEKQGLVVVATGNTYSVPADVEQCLDAATTPVEKGKCVQVPGNWFNSVLGINMANGSLAWGSRVSYFDVWTTTCIPLIPGVADCPVKDSPDYDFGQAPLYFPNTKCGSETKDILVAAQKSGWAYGFDAHTGKMLWSKSAGPGSASGGSQWGSATDGKKTVFLQNANFAFENVTLVNPAPGSSPVAGGGFGTAIDVCTGSIKWQSAMPITPVKSSSTMGPPTYVMAKGGEVCGVPDAVARGQAGCAESLHRRSVDHPDGWQRLHCVRSLRRERYSVCRCRLPALRLRRGHQQVRPGGFQAVLDPDLLQRTYLTGLPHLEAGLLRVECSWLCCGCSGH
eukprot:XP_001696369.1 predicted protein [Chlamydomonas reinhardtii]